MKQKFLSKWIFAGAALLLGLTACNNKNEDDLAREKGYDTYSTVSLSLPASLRADDDDYNKKDVYKGVDHIKTLSLYIIDEDKPTDQPEAHHFAEENLHLDGATGKVTMTPFRTKSGNKTVYAVINITEPIKNTLLMVLPTKQHLKQHIKMLMRLLGRILSLLWLLVRT